MARAKKAGPVEVIWEDAAGRCGWRTDVEAEEHGDGEFVVRTVGYLVKRTKRSLTLAMSETLPDSSAGDQRDHLMRLPLSMIRRVRRLR